MYVYIYYNILYISGCARVWGDLDRAQLKTTRPAIRSKMLVFVHCQIIFSDTGKQENKRIAQETDPNHTDRQNQ